MSATRARGILVTFEGIEGAGKSTQIALCATWLRTVRGRTVTMVREPGGTPLGEALRAILLRAGDAEPIGARAELLLYCASRAQLIDRVIVPALDQGHIVLADRYADASIAYQGAGRDLGLRSTERVVRFATGGIRPIRTYLLDLPVDEGLRRIESRGTPDRLEAEARAFHERVRQGYLRLAEAEGERIRVFDATEGEEAIAARIRDDLASLIDAVGSESAVSRTGRRQ